MEKFYIVVKGNPWTEEQMSKVVKEAAQELAEDAGEDPEKIVVDLKDKVEVLGCFLSQSDAEGIARDAARDYPDRPVFVLVSTAMFEAEDRPVTRTGIW